jgi:hypothetical protein
MPVHYERRFIGVRQAEPLMHNLVTAPIRASRHLAIWIVWQSTGVTLLAPRSRNEVPRIHEGQEGQEAASRGRLRQTG